MNGVYFFSLKVKHHIVANVATKVMVVCDGVSSIRWH